MLLDSNLIILAGRPDYPGLRRFITATRHSISAISIIEVLGFTRLEPLDKEFFDAFLASVRQYKVSSAIINQAVIFRQTRKMSLGDAIIAATAHFHMEPLLTNNLRDFAWIPGLRVSDPLAAGDPP